MDDAEYHKKLNELKANAFVQDKAEADKVICKKFGCGKELAEWEQLYGDYCYRHNRDQGGSA